MDEGMERLLVKGGNKLFGSVEITGAKNAAVAILPAAILAGDGVCVIDNIPDIEDVQCMEKIMRSLGCEIQRNKNEFVIDSKSIYSTDAMIEEVKNMIKNGEIIDAKTITALAYTLI